MSTTVAEFHAYQRGDGPKCGAKGPQTARCVLPPGHDDDHEGNGSDGWGPLYQRWAQ